jgi:hypothetical protein
MFSEGRTNVHDDDRSGHPSLVTADLLDQANEKIRENRIFTMSELSTHFSFHTTRNRHGALAISQIVCEVVWQQSSSTRGIQKLVPRYDRCLNFGGDYVEK